MCITANQPDTKSTNANPYPKTKHPTIVMSYVYIGPSGEIHTRQCRCAVFFTNFKCHCTSDPRYKSVNHAKNRETGKHMFVHEYNCPPPKLCYNSTISYVLDKTSNNISSSGFLVVVSTLPNLGLMAPSEQSYSILLLKIQGGPKYGTLFVRLKPSIKYRFMLKFRIFCFSP